ncbi:MAG: HPr family phosphocarrier protein [Deltaproteobacteria bacterium]|nr:HPr family phosphocarrier protein [Deltaproteobacteria bacterium]MBI2342541.1 HPr family phosphocarrier protein [Deltaproteobacteria bacterium]
MISKTFIISNQLGLHARAAASFVKIANRFRSNISVRKDSVSVNGKSIMGVLMLAAAKGASITIETSGDDESDAIIELAKLIEGKFGEE